MPDCHSYRKLEPAFVERNEHFFSSSEKFIKFHSVCTNQHLWLQHLKPIGSSAIGDITHEQYFGPVSIFINLYLHSCSYLWSLVVVHIKGIPDHLALSKLHAAFHELIIDPVLNESSGTRTAGLAHVPEDSRMALCHCIFNCI